MGRLTTTYLEMTHADQLRPARAADFVVTRAEVPSPELSRFLYATVGGPWSWGSRLEWDRARWLAYLDRPQLETWVGYRRGTPAGYFELERENGDVQIVYFGLLPSFIGQGLGGALLTAALERGWQMSPRRVWVHTCDLDHPHALANYTARGMRPYRVDHHEQQLRPAPRYVHTNLIARDWQRLARFYREVFACQTVPPERAQQGEWLSRATGVPEARLRGLHLRLPGHGEGGPTLEIFTYDTVVPQDHSVANRAGYGHLAFAVDDVSEALADVVAAGGSPLGEIVSTSVEGAGQLELTYARDPEGNIIELQRWR